MVKYYLLTLFLLAMHLPAFAKKDEVKIDFTSIDYSATPKAEQFPQAAAVTLLEEGKISFDKKGILFIKHVIKKILDERGLDLADVDISYIKDYSDIEVIKARTITPEGQTIELDKSQFYEITDFPDFVLYSDYKAKRFTFPAVQPGAVIEYVFAQRLKGINIPPCKFQNENPVMFSKFVLEVPMSIRYKLLKRRGDINLLINEDVRNQSGMVVATYSAKDIPGLNDEPYMPPRYDVLPSISFTPVVYSFLWAAMPLIGNSWATIGEWYTVIIKEPMEANDGLASRSQELVKGCITDQQKAKVICEFVRNNFRYISIDIGNGGVVPHEVKDVYKNRYGDCKDLSALTVTLLRQAGIDAKIGLVRTADQGVMEKSFCSPSVFNHAVVCIPAKTITDSVLQKQFGTGELNFSHDDDWLIFDPTVRWCPFGYLPWTDMGVEVLVINGSNSAFVSTPIGKSSDNVYYTQETVNADGKKEHRDLTLICRGAVAFHYRYMYNSLNYDKRRERIERIIMNLYPSANLDSFSIANLQETDSVLQIKVAFTIAREHDFRNGPQVTSLTVFDDFERINPFTKDKREHPVSFHFPQVNYYSCSFVLADSSLYIKNTSDSLLVDWMPIGKYREVWECFSDKILCTRSLNLQSVWVPNVSYNIVKDLFGKSSAFQPKRILIDKKASKPAPTKSKQKTKI